jgi:glycerol uptake facilitator-like aquaporin
LVALILTFGPISGAHLNPAVTLADAAIGGTPWREVPAYAAAQIGGAFAGVAVAHVMFGEPVFLASEHVREGASQLVSEFVATFGLLATIWGTVRTRPTAVPFAVGADCTVCLAHPVAADRPRRGTERHPRIPQKQEDVA